ncbi:hypothetical protein Slin15195_G121640 [Septoria linicola]|uniref:Uncharacterized protein n=1 Tax=Septoria linicola TaxID=215465 RepID=A0A9Q9EQ80_9PEZI|nr:hypothetical protein Slin14017_G098630 [Septoria linicola]USW58845.1 hypothetical protein Slin15195_G121640 [Septoria linicola]
MPFLLGRKAVSTTSQPIASAATRPAAAAINSLDRIATTALKAKALEQKSSSPRSSTSTAATTESQQQHIPTPETFRTWRVTQPQHWSDGLIRPPSQLIEATTGTGTAAANTRAVASPHWARLPLRGVVGSGSGRQQVLGK